MRAPAVPTRPAGSQQGTFARRARARRAMAIPRHGSPRLSARRRDSGCRAHDLKGSGRRTTARRVSLAIDSRIASRSDVPFGVSMIASNGSTLAPHHSSFFVLLTGYRPCACGFLSGPLQDLSSLPMPERLRTMARMHNGFQARRRDPLCTAKGRAGASGVPGCACRGSDALLSADIVPGYGSRTRATRQASGSGSVPAA